jgi:hypothetical protein
MSGKIGKYTYKNEAVLHEFLGKIIQTLAKRKTSKVVKKLKRDPDLKNKVDAAEKALRKLDMDRKNNPKMDKLLTSLGM